MKLAKIIKQDDSGWQLRDGTRLNPPVGTIVQYYHDAEMYFYKICFPGCTVELGMPYFVFNMYFEGLTDANS